MDMYMASKEDKIADNVPGRFYVDSSCIDCDMCRNLAPKFFAMSDNGGSYVCEQPASDEDIDLCLEAMESCPVDAIGDNGE